MKAFLIVFIIFLLILLLFTQLPKTGEFIKTEKAEKDFAKNNSKWKLIGRVEILNGRIVNMTKNID